MERNNGTFHIYLATVKCLTVALKWNVNCYLYRPSTQAKMLADQKNVGNVYEYCNMEIYFTIKGLDADYRGCYGKGRTEQTGNYWSGRKIVLSRYSHRSYT